MTFVRSLVPMIQAVTLFSVVTICFHAARVVGPGLRFVIVLPRLAPYIGKPYRAFDKVFSLTMILKLLEWSIAGSGALAGYFLYVWLIGPVEHTAEIYALIVASLACVFSAGHKMLLFQDPEASSLTVLLAPLLMRRSKSMRVHLEQLTSQERIAFLAAMARSLFVTIYISGFLQMLTSFALLFFALGLLGVLEVMSPPIKISDALLACALLADWGGGNVFTGHRWVILQSLVKFLVFLWTVVYIALAPGMIRDDELAKLANSIDTAVSPAGPWN